MIGKMLAGAIRIRNFVGTIINPATADKQSDGTQKTQVVDSNNVNATGEVQSTPTSNTILGRLKGVEDKIDILDTTVTDGSQLTSLVDPNDATRKGEFDSKFKVPIHISIEHHEVHEGHSFERHIDSANLSVATLNVAFKTLVGSKLSHMLFGWASNDEILFEVIEGATWTQGSGSLLTIFNHERNSGGSSLIMLEDQAQPTFTANNSLIKNVTNISGGIIFDNQYTYNASLGANVSSETRQAGHEWNLKADTTYIVRITKTDANCKMSINLHWYEHTTE